jgi:hypothetical protein
MITYAQKNYLESVAKQIVADAKSNLKQAKGSTKLAGSIDYDLTINKDEFIVEFKMDPYGNFVDKGVKGKGGSIGDASYGGRRWYTTWEGKRLDSPYAFGKSGGGGLRRGIDKWIKTKGLKGRVDKNWKSAGNRGGQFITDKSLAFLITRAIYIKGMHGISFFQNAIQKGIKDLSEGYEVAFVNDFEQSIEGAIK